MNSLGPTKAAHAFSSGLAASASFLLFLLGYAIVLVFFEANGSSSLPEPVGSVVAVLMFVYIFAPWGVPIVFVSGFIVGPLFAFTSKGDPVRSGLQAIPIGLLGSTMAVGLFRVVFSIPFSLPLLVPLLIATCVASYLYGFKWGWRLEHKATGRTSSQGSAA
jgi:hypothetical protein